MLLALIPAEKFPVVPILTYRGTSSLPILTFPPTAPDPPEPPTAMDALPRPTEAEVELPPLPPPPPMD